MLNPLICSVLVASSQEDPSGSHWNVMTYQGETKLEECEQKAGLKTCGDVCFSRNTVFDPTHDVLHSESFRHVCIDMIVYAYIYIYICISVIQ